jgi:hypothetical protein
MTLDTWLSSYSCQLCKSVRFVPTGSDSIPCPACVDTNVKHEEVDLRGIDFLALRILLDRGFDFWPAAYYLRLHSDLEIADLLLRQAAVALAEASVIDQVSLVSECTRRSKIDIFLDSLSSAIDSGDYEWLRRNSDCFKVFECVDELLKWWNPRKHYSSSFIQYMAWREKIIKWYNCGWFFLDRDRLLFELSVQEFGKFLEVETKLLSASVLSSNGKVPELFVKFSHDDEVVCIGQSAHSHLEIIELDFFDFTFQGSHL